MKYPFVCSWWTVNTSCRWLTVKAKANGVRRFLYKAAGSPVIITGKDLQVLNVFLWILFQWHFCPPFLSLQERQLEFTHFLLILPLSVSFIRSLHINFISLRRNPTQPVLSLLFPQLTELGIYSAISMFIYQESAKYSYSGVRRANLYKKDFMWISLISKQYHPGTPFIHGLQVSLTAS